MNKLQKPEQDYIWLINLSKEDRINALYKETPHSLSRVCHQCIDSRVFTTIDVKAVVEDMMYAVLVFWRKAQQWDILAINSLWRFSKHISQKWDVRAAFMTKLGGQKDDFDNQMLEIYTTVIWMLHEKPVYVKYIKDVIEDTSSNIVSVLDNSDVKDLDVD